MSGEGRTERYKQEVAEALEELAVRGIDVDERLLGTRDDVVLDVRCTLKHHLMGRVYKTARGFIFVSQVVYDEDPDKRGRWLGDNGYPESLLLAPWRNGDELFPGGGRYVESTWPYMLCRCRERHAQWHPESLRESAEEAWSSGKRTTYLG